MTRIETSALLADRYRLVRLIAAGGMGTVWEAHDVLLDRPVALKSMAEGLAADPEFVERFRREARAAGRLTHPNLARVYDFGDDGGTPFLVMELIDGETLHDRIGREGPLPVADAALIARAIAAGLEAAHGAGIVHRDVKPANVMLDRAGGVKITDFGIAAAASNTRLTQGSGLGTATYASPEQTRGERVTAASDVYSLGVVTYEMLTGLPPFDGPSPVAIALAHAEQEPQPIRAARPEVPAGVAAVVERALAKDPRDRPESAEAFAGELSQAMGATSPRTERLAPATVPLPPAGPAPPPTMRETRPPRSPSRWPWVAVLATLALLVGAILVARAELGGGSSPPGSSPSPSSSPSVALLTIPPVAGMHQDQAVQELAAAGFPASIVMVQVEHAEPNVVIRTDPPAGTAVLPGTVVTVYVESPRHGKDKGGGNG
ncbi:MAG: serine/threonine protein kinase [Actinobacteria bacterium]|nr:MAG: serine/threonine protein kinase [Actinomycetota bacterium]